VAESQYAGGRYDVLDPLLYRSGRFSGSDVFRDL